jgi:hypothetical protein
MRPKKPVVPVRVMLGPKQVDGGYVRIVAQKDGSGLIESFDTASKTWSEAAQEVTFAVVWSAPAIAPELWARIGGIGDTAT